MVATLASSHFEQGKPLSGGDGQSQLAWRHQFSVSNGIPKSLWLPASVETITDPFTYAVVQFQFATSAVRESCKKEVDAPPYYTARMHASVRRYATRSFDGSKLPSS